MKAATPELLDEIARELADEFNPEEIILFGSHAWGAPDEHSDIDILVIVSESDEPPARLAIRAHRRLSHLGVPKDILVKTRAEADRYRHLRASLMHKIFTEGRRLHGWRLHG